MTGFINVNKARGVSSAREVSVIKRLTGMPCGHMGTLDPMASGVLPVAIGNAARLFDYFLDKSKMYIASFRFGFSTDSLDTTGSVISSGGRIPSQDEIEEILHEFKGNIEQMPPKFSAKSVGGKRSYQLARSGVDFELKPKIVRIEDIKLLDHISADEFSFEIKCGGGTYIRSIARDMGNRLGTFAVMNGLVRTASGIFDIKDSVETKDLTSENYGDFIIKTQDVLNFESIYASQSESKRLLNGLSVRTDNRDGIYKLFVPDDLFYGLAEVRENILKVRTKLC